MPDQSPAVVKSIYPSLYVGDLDPLFGTRPQVMFGYQFYNGLPVSVTVSLRTGARYIIPPIPGIKSRSFIVVTSYQHSNHVNFDTRDLLDAEGIVSSNEAKAIESALYSSINQPSILNRVPATGSVKYALTKKDFDLNGGEIYLANLDLLVSIYNFERSTAHPGTIHGQCNAFLNEDPILSDLKGFSFTVQIIDRHKTFGDRFVNVCGTVFRIPVTNDPSKVEGVFIRHNGPSAGGDVMYDIPDVRCYTFEEAEKIEWLYKTHNEALTLGNPESVLQRESLQKKMELMQLETDIKKEDLERRRELDMQKRQFEAEREQAKHEEQIRNQRLIDRELELKSIEIELSNREKIWKSWKEERNNRHELEMASHKTKVEWAKTASVVIGIIGAGIALYKQLSK